MAGALQRAWLERGALAVALLPVSWVYAAVTRLHRAAYATGLRKPVHIGVPVVLVGNVVTGGAGKTPVVIAVVEHLRSRGLSVGVVSRGYGRSTTDTREVRAGDEPSAVGDEPLLVRLRTNAPVFVGRARAEAARALLRAYPETAVIVSDDGLQHHALARDVEICVFDARGVGNGWLLPAGPLREPWPRRSRFRLLRRSAEVERSHSLPLWARAGAGGAPPELVLHQGAPAGIAGFRTTRRLATQAVRADGTRRPLEDFADRACMALAAIAQPESFFAMLSEAGIATTRTLAFPDHHAFAEGELPTGGTLLCTEKDAVKVWRFRPDAWAVPLEVRIPDGFFQALDRLLEAKLSSRDGSQTA